MFEKEMTTSFFSSVSAPTPIKEGRREETNEEPIEEDHETRRRACVTGGVYETPESCRLLSYRDGHRII